MRITEKKEKKVPISSIVPGGCFRGSNDRIYMIVDANHYNISYKGSGNFGDDWFTIIAVRLVTGELTRFNKDDKVIPVYVTGTVEE